MDIFVWGLLGAMIIPALIGMFVLFHLFRSQHEPADTSNRINKIRLFWFVMTREELFVDKFPWLTNDEYDNIKDTEANK